MHRLDESIKNLIAEIDDMMEIYEEMPKGCGSCPDGKVMNKKRMQYLRDEINPKKFELAKLKKERKSDV